MQATTPKAVETIREGGFRIDIEPEELTVARDRRAAGRGAGSIALRVLLVLAVAAVCFKLLSDTFPTLYDAPLSVLLVVAVLIALVVLWSRQARVDNIHCTPKHLEVIRVANGRPTAKRVFLRAWVREISFTAVSWSKSGPTFALVFKVDGKEVEVLRGIESPEAQTVLRELQRLGYDVELDVGMAMMVEMARDRRRNPEE